MEAAVCTWFEDDIIELFNDGGYIFPRRKIRKHTMLVAEHWSAHFYEEYYEI